MSKLKLNALRTEALFVTSDQQPDSRIDKVVYPTWGEEHKAFYYTIISSMFIEEPFLGGIRVILMTVVWLPDFTVHVWL